MNTLLDLLDPEIPSLNAILEWVPLRSEELAKG
jgi:hypothetical protein